MSRILTGIQATGRPHLGNILGAIEPALALSASQPAPSFFFIANLHTLTAVKDASTLQENTLEVAAAWLACGLDTRKDVFYRQSAIPEVTELTWYLNCCTPFPMLANAHSFKDKSAHLAEVNAGLFTYPVLMAADILLYQADVVPVGKDQKQHLEMTRDIASAFNRAFGETLVLPEARISEAVMTIPGIDGRKMSKSYNNYLNIFEEEKALRKRVMQIVTDSTPVEAPKNPDTCNVMAIYRLVAPATDVAALEARYRSGGMGYGEAKQALFEALLTRFATARERYAELKKDPAQIIHQLEEGEARAREIAHGMLDRVRKAIGFA
ncbi:MAG: tryptophan--tRNA ligase [Bacteroidetes bacterium]|nr:tryptophan--tRNA ligase [Bacteroidota bacterium]